MLMPYFKKYWYRLKYNRLHKWIYNPPTQEYILPMLFSTKPSILLWLARKLPNKDLIIYSHYFSPSQLIENTMRKNFFKYHSKLFPFATPPPWFTNLAEKCELYPMSKICQALIEGEYEMKKLKSDNQLEFMKKNKLNKHKEFEQMFEYGSMILEEKYKRENKDLLEIMPKEKNYILARYKQNRDIKRELEILRKETLLKRIDQMGKLVGEDQKNILKEVLNSVGTAYEFYKVTKDFLRGADQENTKVFKDAIGYFEFAKMEPSEKSAMPHDEQFIMKFDELYGIEIDLPLKDNEKMKETLNKVAPNV